jgi:hypothetical protein
MRAAALAAAFSQGGGAPAAAAQAAAAAQQQQQQRNTGFEGEMEINDFPQNARWKVTHKGFQAEITELTGAAVTTKGIYVKSGGLLGCRKTAPLWGCFVLLLPCGVLGCYVLLRACYLHICCGLHSTAYPDLTPAPAHQHIASLVSLCYVICYFCRRAPRGRAQAVPADRGPH